MTVLGYPLLSCPVAWWRSSSPMGLGYRHYASTHPLKRIANGGPQGSHLNPPSNGALAPARVLCMCAPPNFSIKAVHVTPQGSLFGKPLVESHLRLPHWSWVLPSASHKLIKNITSLLFLSAELGHRPRGQRRMRRRLSLTIRVSHCLPPQSFSFTRTSALTTLKCRSTVEQGLPPVGTA